MTTHQLHAAPSTDLLFRVLGALYLLSPMQARTDAGSLARRLGISPTAAMLALVRLERLGLADAAKARLTLRGLAVAATHAATLERTERLPRVA
jgi:Mn-dependent DtxR family transcriptional regulator